MTTFHNGILDIPGLMPVNIGSSKPYPVPFAPQVRPQAGSSAPATSYQDPGTLPGSVSPGLGNISGFQGAGIDGTGVTMGGGIGGSGIGDAQFATMGLNGFAPGFSNYSSFAPQVHPAQGVNHFGGVGLGSTGQSLLDRINSIGNSPHITGGNIAQGAINAAGMFTPLAPILAGIGQGLNLWDAPGSTDNGAVDLLGTPGALQTGSADIANWINRQFGGDYMPIATPQPPDMSGQLSGALATQHDPGAQAMVDQITGDNPLMGFGDAQPAGGAQNVMPDFFSWGGNVLDMGGAGIFNSIGATPWGGGGFGGGGPSGDYMHIQPDNNGGWGQ